MSLNFLDGLDFSPTRDALPADALVKYEAVCTRFDQELARCTELDHARPFENPDAFTRLRFLQADKMDVDKAVKRLVGCICWRQTLHIEEVLKQPSIGLPRYFRARIFRFVGFDRHDRPLMVERLAEFCFHCAPKQ